MFQEATAESEMFYQRIYQLVNTTDRGSVAILIMGPKSMDTEYAHEIDTLLQGFSFDGEACKGPSGLRKAKSIFDNLCDRGMIEMR